MNKNRKGFTLVELIVVIAVLALLAVGAVIAFQGIQANARRSVLSADTNALVNALNAYNATASARGVQLMANTPPAMVAGGTAGTFSSGAAGGGWQIVLGVPAANGLSAENFIVSFDSQPNAARAISAVLFTAPPTAVSGAPGTFTINSDAIASWDTRSATV